MQPTNSNADGLSTDSDSDQTDHTKSDSGSGEDISDIDENFLQGAIILQFFHSLPSNQ
jgi:hypothetical protein